MKILENSVEFANSLIAFCTEVMKAETPLLKHYGLVSITTNECKDVISLWACRCDYESENPVLNPIQRIEQLVQENNRLKEQLSLLEKEAKNV